MTQTRKQLTLFLDEKEAQAIEALREKYNPAQYQLIASHITLCREDEIADLPRVWQNVEKLHLPSFTLELGKAERFYEGKGVFIPVRDPRQEFKGLRARILRHLPTPPREHSPHITLMHPRNSTCTDQIFEEIRAIALPNSVSLTYISLIEQEMGNVWQTLESYSLGRV